MKPAFPCLVLDGSAREGVRVGVSVEGRWLSEASSEKGPLEAAADCVRSALGSAGLSVDDVRSFAVCAGPGSILGVRLTAMMARTWTALAERPCFVWNSLEAVGLATVASGVSPPFAVISESRLKRWNVLPFSSDGIPGACVELEAAKVGALGLPLVGLSEDAPFPTLKGTDAWPQLPALFTQGLLLKAEARPDALNPASEFAVWSGERHRGAR